MRIIAENHDYYDCVQAQGQDRSCTWVRHLEECVFSGWPFPECSVIRYTRGDDLRIQQVMVGFCGKVYPILIIGQRFSDNVICHSIDDVDDYIKENYREPQIKAYEDSKRFCHKHQIGVRKHKLKEFYEECKQKQGSFTSIFVDNDCPVFVARYEPYHTLRHFHSLVFHGRRHTDKDPVIPGAEKIEIKKIGRRGGLYNDLMLKDVEFYKYFPTQVAFQEIHMYLAGVLGFDNPFVPVPDDVTMRDIKGFNDWSFKKEPSKKK